MAQVSGTGRGKRLRSFSTRKVGYAVGLLIAVLGGLFVTFASTAGAATEATVAPIGKTNPADYATYPDGMIPGSCGTDGAAVLANVSYTITHAGVDRTVTNLSAEQLFIGDTVTMSWTGYANGCDTLGVSLAVKSTDHNTFVITDNQHLVSYQYCSGSDCNANAQGVRHLSIQVPSKQAACNFQFDAVIGPPLNVVGPNGSYYGNGLRQQAGKHGGPNMLIGASNGGKGECVAPTANASQSCTTEGGPSVDVAVTNPDANDVATVDVLKNGNVVSGGVTIPANGGTTHVSVPFAVNETGTVSVNWTDSAGPVVPVQEIFTQEFTFDCLHPGAAITHTCAEGVVIDFTNTGEAAGTLTVTKGGTVIDTVIVPGNGTAHRVYPMGEDETATYRVTGTGFDSGDQTFTHDCVAAESTTTTSTTVPDTVQGTEVVRATTLPRTGSGSTLPMSTTAGLLLMAGGVLLALANRPVPTAASATTRSRGR